MIRLPMSKPYQRALFVFRRDLRLADNTALARAAELAEEVVPCFVFDPRQADPEENPYFSAPAFEFMLESLEDLDRQLRDVGGRLYLYRIDLSAIISKWIGEDREGRGGGQPGLHPLRPAAGRRDPGAVRLPRGSGSSRRTTCCWLPPERLRTGQGTPYRVFTPFWKAARKEAVPKPGAGRRSSPG